MDTVVHSSVEGHREVVLTTPRMVLRVVCEHDLEPLHRKIFDVSDVMKQAFGGRVLSKTESDSFIRTHFSFTAQPTGLAVLVDRFGGEIIGFAGLNPCTALLEPDLEIGFVLARDAWGQGLATEIGRAQLALGFEKLNRPRMLALAAVDNTASIHTLTKLGMQYHSQVQPEGRSLRRVYCLDAEAWRRTAK